MRRRQWPRRIGAGAAALAVLLIALAVMPLGPSDASGPQSCFDPQPFPDLPTPAAGNAGTELREANRLAAEGRLALAAKLYEGALEEDATAIKGLAYVEARTGAAERVAASAERLARANRGDAADTCFQQALALDPANDRARAGLTPDERVFPARALDRWDAFYARWLNPLGAVLLAALGVLAVLLVLSRLLTPVAAPAGSLAWPDWVRRVAWWSGLALVVLAVLRTVALLGWPPPWLDDVSDDLRLPATVLLVGTAATLLWAGRHARHVARLGDRGATVHLSVPAVAAVGLAVTTLALVAFALVTRPVAPVLGLRIPDAVWPWLIGIEVALLGVVLLALGRGHALHLRVTVKKGGTPDGAGTAYVLARLRELGTSPPEGLKAPQQVDVTDLPVGDLSGLPVGKVAAALVAALGLLRLAEPWRAVVEDHGDGRMSVTVSRNGSVVRPAILDGERFRAGGRTTSGGATAAGAAGDPTTVSRNLLTAAAAVILTELAAAHPSLRRGLCGATRWDSVAAHVVATRPGSAGRDPEFERELLAYAIQQDPGNALAQAAYRERLGKDARSRADFTAHAERLCALLDAIDRQRRNSIPGGTPSDEDGYGPLRLRSMHSIAAAWMNAAASEGGTLEDVDRARVALSRMRGLLDELRAAAGRPDPFLDEFLALTDELGVALEVIPPVLSGPVVASAADEQPRHLDSLQVAYDRACHLAVVNDRSSATEQLRLAAGLPSLRRQAERDPWLRVLRTPIDGHDPVPADFWGIVGPATPAFTGLAFFGDKGKNLAELGLTHPAALLTAAWSSADRADLSERLAVPAGVVRRWRGLCELAAPPAGGTWLGARHLHVLSGAGIVSLAELESRADEGEAALRAALDETATNLRTHPFSDAEFAEVVLRLWQD